MNTEATHAAEIAALRAEVSDLRKQRIRQLPPELAKAIVASQKAAEVLERDGKGDKGKYTTGDAVAAEARRVLNLHGAAWMLLDAYPVSAGLGSADIGQQSYVGDIVQQWVIVHESGAMLEGGGRMPVVVSKGRPHDKAVGASLTYGVGVCLRGAMCFVREDKNAIDKRVDDSPPADVQSAAGAQACRTKVERVAELSNIPPGEVWRALCTKLTIEPMDDGGPPTADDLTVGEGKIVLAYLETEVKRLEADRKPESSTVETYLAKKGPRCGGKAAALGGHVRTLVEQMAGLLGHDFSATWASVLRKDAAGVPAGVNPEQLLTADGKRLAEKLEAGVLALEAKRAAAVERAPGDEPDELDPTEVQDDDAKALADAARRVSKAFPGTHGRAEAPA